MKKEKLNLTHTYKEIDIHILTIIHHSYKCLDISYSNWWHINDKCLDCFHYTLILRLWKEIGKKYKLAVLALKTTIVIHCCFRSQKQWGAVGGYVEYTCIWRSIRLQFCLLWKPLSTRPTRRHW